MKIRYINNQDSEEIYIWRNDSKTRSMSINKKLITRTEHNYWFKNSLNNINREILIAEIKESKLGICRFDFNEKLNIAQIAINMNPEFRGKGYGKKLLKEAINHYLNKKNCVLIAKIKVNNLISKNLFLSIGFKITGKDKDFFEMEFIRKLEFKKVGKSDVDILYELLRNRKHNISHNIMPEFDVHKNFVDSNPYLHWYKFSLDKKVIGTFYIKSDNSIGLNLNVLNKAIVSEILEFILRNFSPQKPVASQIPNYFFVNVPENNNDLKNIIESLGHSKLQVSYKLFN
tara:strand:+ start:7854 stop:8714 length:861 start_codon:yes stop_codon:yes gene_type:complete